MSAQLYDKAITEKIKNWVVDPNLTILYPDEVRRFFQEVADQNNDKIKLPLIAISRDRDYELDLTSKLPQISKGLTFNVNNGIADSLKSIPMKLHYQISVYTRYREEAEEYVRNLVFNIILNPTLTIQIPYNNSKIEQNSYMKLQSTIRDASDIPERLISGQFTRIVLKVDLPDARLFSYTTNNVIPTINKVGLQISDTLKDNNYPCQNITVIDKEEN